MEGLTAKDVRDAHDAMKRSGDEVREERLRTNALGAALELDTQATVGELLSDAQAIYEWLNG